MAVSGARGSPLRVDMCRTYRAARGHFLTLAVATKIDNNPTLELSIGYPITHPVASVIV
jgi:hypothetical protein